MSKVVKSQTKASVSKPKAKRGRPSKVDQLGRRVQYLTGENQEYKDQYRRLLAENNDLWRLLNSNIELRKLADKLTELQAERLEKMECLYYNLRDVVAEEGNGGEDIISPFGLAMRYAHSKYRMN